VFWSGVLPASSGWEGVDRFHLAQDRDLWWTFVNVVMNVQVPQKGREFFD
jgi:hypothetical protein